MGGDAAANAMEAGKASVPPIGSRRLDWRLLDPGQPLGAVLFFRFCHDFTLLVLTLVYRLRSHGTRSIPRVGGLVLVANHQSHLDPPTIGCALPHRHIVPIARMGLFKNPVLGWLITRLNSISINEKEGDAVAIRRAVRELQSGRCILIFPEGARSPNGEVQPFKRGTWLLLSRAKCPVVPVAIDGAFDAWPRHRRLPRVWRQRLAVRFGDPIAFETLERLGSDGAMATLAEQVGGLLSAIRSEPKR